MKLTLPIRQGVRVSLCLFLLLQILFSNSYSQTLTTIDYSTSGLPRTDQGGTYGSTDVFATTPTLQGLSHTTLQSDYQYTIAYNSDQGIQYVTVYTLPPGFDGTAIQLGASCTNVLACDSHNNCGNQSYFITDSYQIGYTFSPGNVYFASMHYSGVNVDLVGVGISVGTPQYT